MHTRRWASSALLAAACLTAGPAFAQDAETAPPAETRPAGVTFLGDTGLWFVPTAEVVRGGRVAASGHVATFNREQGFTAIQAMTGTIAAGLGDRAELFASVPFLTRIDRDLRPAFDPGQPRVGGVITDYPLVTQPFSGNAFGDVVVGVKLNLVSEREASPFAAAARSWIRLPTGDEAAGASTGRLDGAFGLIFSKAFGAAEAAAHYDIVLRGDSDTLDLPNSVTWGVGVGGPVRGPVRVFGEVIGDALFRDRVLATTPLVGYDNSLSGLILPQYNPIDLVLGAEVRVGGFSVGGGVTWAARHEARSVANQPDHGSDRTGFMVRVNYHPGVGVYVPPPPPPPPPANQSPTVTVSCDPCEVEFEETVALRADAADPDGDPLTFAWNAPAGSFTDDADGATTTWQAPAQEGPVPISVTVTDGRGGSASDTANVLVNAPPPPPRREYVFEDIHFDFDRYSLRDGAARVLDEVVAALAEDADLRIQIEGHTCNIGTNEYNLALGDRRASSVQDYLTARGVTADRLQTVSYGEERPEHDNAREETRRLNRRAALVVRVQ